MTMIEKASLFSFDNDLNDEASDSYTGSDQGHPGDGRMSNYTPSTTTTSSPSTGNGLVIATNDDDDARKRLVRNVMIGVGVALIVAGIAVTLYMFAIRPLLSRRRERRLQELRQSKSLPSDPLPSATETDLTTSHTTSPDVRTLAGSTDTMTTEAAARCSAPPPLLTDELAPDSVFASDTAPSCRHAPRESASTVAVMVVPTEGCSDTLNRHALSHLPGTEEVVFDVPIHSRSASLPRSIQLQSFTDEGPDTIDRETATIGAIIHGRRPTNPLMSCDLEDNAPAGGPMPTRLTQLVPATTLDKAPLSAYGQPSIMYTYEPAPASNVDASMRTAAGVASTVSTPPAPPLPARRQRSPVLGRVLRGPRTRTTSRSSRARALASATTVVPSGAYSVVPLSPHDHGSSPSPPPPPLAAAAAAHSTRSLPASSTPQQDLPTASTSTTGLPCTWSATPDHTAAHASHAGHTVAAPTTTTSSTSLSTASGMTSALAPVLPHTFTSVSGADVEPRSRSDRGDELAETGASSISNSTAASLWVIGKLASSADVTYSTLSSTSASTLVSTVSARPDNGAVARAQRNRALAAALESVADLDVGGPLQLTSSVWAPSPTRHATRVASTPPIVHDEPRGSRDVSGFAAVRGVRAHTAGDDTARVPPTTAVSTSRAAQEEDEADEEDEDLSPDERDALAAQARHDRLYAQVAAVMQMHYHGSSR